MRRTAVCARSSWPGSARCARSSSSRAGAAEKAFSLSAEKLAEAFRAGSVSVVALEGVVGRVLTEALQEAVNDPAPSALQAVG
ncbi:hypothetical protein [Massilia sp. Se16.2.3]|uniref:hypothetical protein n=1 Tax=Massilia sp. Se16.2.3 TaxID=2709303 RepID=UPI001E455945|nr:hypothetical protein [Massilia sp. Se16.2.3]